MSIDSTKNSTLAIASITISTPFTANPIATTHLHPFVSFNNSYYFISLKLDTTNYIFWKTEMKRFLYGQDLLDYIDGTLPYLHWPLPISSLAESLLLNQILYIYYVQTGPTNHENSHCLSFHLYLTVGY